MKQQLKNLKFLSLFLVIFMFFVSCGTDEDNAENPIGKGGSDGGAIISGKAIDGYLKNSIVCLDLDDSGDCNSASEPTTTTDNTGSYKLNISSNHKMHSNYNNAAVIVYGGVDVDSGQNFIGKLKATNNGKSTINITPTTTLIDNMDLPYADAKTKVATIFGVDETQIERDPIADNNLTLFAKAVALQRAVDLLVATDDGTDSDSTKANNIMVAIAKGLTSQTTEQSIEDIVGAADISSINTKAKNALKLAQELAKSTKDTYKDINQRADYAKKCESYVQDAKQIVKENSLTNELPDSAVEGYKENIKQKSSFQATIKGSVKDEGGVAYKNRTVFLKDNVSVNNGNGGFYTTQTDDNGNYSFLVFTKGSTYTLWLSLEKDEEQIEPSPGGKGIVFNDTAEITTTDSIVDMDFITKFKHSSATSCGNTEAKAIVCGKLFADKNGNKTFDVGEQVFKDSTVWIQDITNGGFYTTQTDSNGDYNYPAYNTGQFKMWIDAHISYSSDVVSPVEADKGHYPFYYFNMNEGDDKRVDFVIRDKGVIPVTVSGRVYRDDDANGVYSHGDRPIYKRQIFLVPKDGSAPIYFLTNHDGMYYFQVEKNSNNWHLKQPTLKDGTILSPTFNSGGYLDLGTIDSDKTYDIRFEGISTSSTNVIIKGRVYEDKNGNGVYDEGTDSPAPNINVFLRNKADADAGNGGGFYTSYSSATGSYSFVLYKGGEYKIWFALPTGKKETTSPSCKSSQTSTVHDDWSADDNCGGIVFHTREFNLNKVYTMDFGFADK
jgi:hypothetical protein